MKKRINFTSGTTSATEIMSVLFGILVKKDYKKEFISRLKKELGFSSVYLFSAGRTGLYCICKALGIGKGDEVIIEGYTCVAVPKAIMYAKATPIYADINKQDYNLNLESVKEKITPKTKAIVVQHTYGIPCHAIFEIEKLCKENNLYLIEDCAHEMGGSIKEKKLGTIGDVAFYSTDDSKYISTSMGGFVATNNKVIAKKLDEVYENVPELAKEEQKAILFQYIAINILRNKIIMAIIKNSKFASRMEKKFWEWVNKNNLLFGMDDYSNTEWPTYTFPAKMSSVQSNIGAMQMRKYKKIRNRRKEICELYIKELGSRFYVPKDANNLLRFPLLVNDPVKAESLLKDICKVEFWFHPPIKCIRRIDFPQFMYDEEKYPNASYIAEHVINLPIHLKVTDREIKKICQIIKESDLEGV